MRRFGVFVLALVVLLLGAPTARAQTGDERITAYAFDATIEDDGDLVVERGYVRDVARRSRATD